MQNVRTTKGSFARKNASSFRARPGHKSFGPRNNNNNGRSKRGDYIDPSRFVRKATDSVAEKGEIKHTFNDFKFCPELTANLNKRNYHTPTPIQDQSISHILEGKDLVGLANTGTGKTAAFLLPLINKVNKDRTQKVLIVAPTRELALQIESELHKFSWGMRIFFATCVGGMPIGKQIASLRRNPNFIIGTPGRLKDLCGRRLINLSTFNNVVLDEVDRMLDMGFVDEIRQFLNQLPKERQSLFFSATIPPKIRDLVASFAKNPVTVSVSTGQTADSVEQDIVKVTNRDMKFGALTDLLADPELSKVLIFTETKRDVEKLAVTLTQGGFKAESIHGDKRQGQRARALNSFKNNEVGILVATDVAARGLDIKDVTHVINYTIPKTYDDYIHRIGRTGRGDKSGKALTFVEAR
jgi:superfamily II DNA/RNA helicase